MDNSAISFGPFRLHVGQRLLLEDDKPVRIGSRALDILVTLVDRAGEVVKKEELISQVWPRTFVEESNLKLQVCALRRALGDGHCGHRYIVNVPGRGYNFVAPIRREKPPPARLPATVAAQRAPNLPFAVTRLIGREEAASTLVGRLSRQRLVTIVGPGGIGKTAVALAGAERMINSFEHGVWLVDLAPLGDARLMPSAVATVLGLGSTNSGEPITGRPTRSQSWRARDTRLAVGGTVEETIKVHTSVARSRSGTFSRSGSALWAAIPGAALSPSPDSARAARETLSFV